jgi:hypothetical protein
MARSPRRRQQGCKDSVFPSPGVPATIATIVSAVFCCPRGRRGILGFLLAFVTLNEFSRSGAKAGGTTIMI